MNARVLTIGDEILIGQIVNTNAAWIGAELTAIGVSVSRMVTVGDEASDIERELSESLEAGRITVVTGGLGPTHDDITRDVVASVFGVELEFHPEIMDVVRGRFERRGFDMPEVNRNQAMIPEGFEAIINQAGTAPALLKRYDHPDGPGLLAVVPGVPHEMQAFMQDNILPLVIGLEGAPSILQKTLLTAGVGESHLHEALAGVQDLLIDGLSLAYLPNLTSLRLRLSSTNASAEDGARDLDKLEKFIRGRAGEWIYGEGEDTLESVLGGLLIEQGSSIALAESCTGGWIANRLTNVPGSSAFVVGGVVSYSNESKRQLLGVRAETLEKFGAVSRQTACEMAEGVRLSLDSGIGLSTTGVLGPGGGSDEKPVGTIWIGISSAVGTSAVQLRLGKDRLRNKERAATAALNLVRRVLLKRSRTK